MNITTLEPILKMHLFFAGMNDAAITLISGCAKNVRFDAGTSIARQGEAADEFYLIREGRVGVAFPSPQGEMTIQTLNAGDIVGWSWLMPPYEWQFDVTAVTATRAIAMDGKCLRTTCEEDTRLGYELMKRLSRVMVERLQATRIQLLDVYGDKG